MVAIIDYGAGNTKSLQFALERLGASHILTSDIEKIIRTQIAREKRINLADDVINNDQDITFLKNQVKSLHQKYLYLAKQPATNSA